MRRIQVFVVLAFVAFSSVAYAARPILPLPSKPIPKPSKPVPMPILPAPIKLR